MQRVEIGQGIGPLRARRATAAAITITSSATTAGACEPFTDDGLERAIEPRSASALPLRVSEHEIVIHGACETCAGS